MKLTVSRDALHAALQPLARITPTKTTLPVLENILLRATDDGLALAATDLQIAMTRTLTATVIAPGTITVPASTLADYVAGLPDGQSVSLELDAKTRRVAVTCGRFRANLAGIEAQEFPPMEMDTPTHWMTLPAALLADVIGDVEYAAALDESRPVLAGVGVQAATSGAGYAWAAADGFRLVTRFLPRSDDVMNPWEPLILPAHALRQLQRVLPKDDTPARLDLGDTLLRCDVGATSFTMRLIAGQFPDYVRIIPTDPTLCLIADRQALLHAVQMARVFTKTADKSEQVVCTVDPETRTLSIAATAREVGDGTSSVDLLDVRGDAMQVVYNGRYLAQALEHLRSEQVELSCAGPLSPGMVRPVGAEHDAVMAIIMPMHVVGAK